MITINRDGYNSEFYPLVGDELDYFLGNIWEKHTRTIEFEAKINVFLHSNNKAVSHISTYPSPQNTFILFAIDDLNAFEEFVVGDTILIQNTTTLNDGYTGTIVQKIDNQTIQLDNALPSGVQMSAGDILCTTEYEGIRYFYNLIENNEPLTYNSKIDQEEQKLTKDAYPYASTSIETLIFNGKKSYQSGGATV